MVHTAFFVCSQSRDSIQQKQHHAVVLASHLQPLDFWKALLMALVTLQVSGLNSVTLNPFGCCVQTTFARNPHLFPAVQMSSYLPNIGLTNDMS